jgi:hypothetical protein
MILNTSGNLGLGVTPSAWGSLFGAAIQVRGGSILGYSTDVFDISQNAYADNSGYKYVTTAAASQYRQESGSHKWYQVALGSANAAITFTQAMTLTANGRLLINKTNEETYQLDVNGTGRFSAQVYGWGFRDYRGIIASYGQSDAGAYINAYGNTGYGGTTNTLVFGTNNTDRLTISTTGAATFSSTLGIGGVSDSVKGGTYTPTINTTTNIASSSVGTWQYLRVGNTVTVSGSITITPTLAVSTTSFNFSLPINSTFATGNDCAGTGVDYNATTYLMVNGNSGAANFGLGLFKSTTTAAMTLSIQFTYKII